MNKLSLLSKISVCIFLFALTLYLHVERQNSLMKLRMEIPKLTKAIKECNEEMSRLYFEIEQFENPTHLMDLAALPEYSHLRHPYLKDIINFPQGLVFQEENERPSLLLGME
ncbi:MAG TPA: hypothetical protein VLG44_02720 [Chlamydiales bacterium]|nr:hypothetical protein [Chlamydiales bacterium]